MSNSKTRKIHAVDLSLKSNRLVCSVFYNFNNFLIYSVKMNNERKHSERRKLYLKQISILHIYIYIYILSCVGWCV
jgi:hypothetical protein